MGEHSYSWFDNIYIREEDGHIVILDSYDSFSCTFEMDEFDEVYKVFSILYDDTNDDNFDDEVLLGNTSDIYNHTGIRLKGFSGNYLIRGRIEYILDTLDRFRKEVLYCNLDSLLKEKDIKSILRNKSIIQLQKIYNMINNRIKQPVNVE